MCVPDVLAGVNCVKGVSFRPRVLLTVLSGVHALFHVGILFDRFTHDRLCYSVIHRVYPDRRTTKDPANNTSSYSLSLSACIHSSREYSTL